MVRILPVLSGGAYPTHTYTYTHATPHTLLHTTARSIKQRGGKRRRRRTTAVSPPPPPNKERTNPIEETFVNKHPSPHHFHFAFYFLSFHPPTPQNQTKTTLLPTTSSFLFLHRRQEL